MPVHEAPAGTAGPGQHALNYAALGWRVLPIKPGEKRPPMSSWQHAASSEPKVIINWFKGLYRGHGVGVATGGPSPWVLDIDTGPDKPGEASLAELEAKHGPLPVTVEAVTGSGGRHLYFNYPADRRVLTRRDTRQDRSPLPAGIDVRGEGGQVLAPPTVHPNGTVYAWREGRSPWEIEVADAPDWLLDIVCETETPAVPDATPSTFFDEYERDSIAELFRRDNTWDALLIRDGWTPLPPQGDQQYWVRPGKEKRDGHSAVLHLPDGPFVIFSTDGSLARYAQSWARVATGDGWAFSKFGYEAAARHGGDRSATAKRLRADRDGHPAPAVSATVTRMEQRVSVGLRELLAEGEDGYDWLVPGVLERGDRVILTGEEGKGKSTLLRQWGVQMASGIHPFTEEEIDPLRVLLVDLENSRRQVKRKIRALDDAAGERYQVDNLRLIIHPEGLDLGIVEHCALLQRWIETEAPDVLIIGPLYKLAGGDPTKEEASKPVALALDRFRTLALNGFPDGEPNMAILMEAHSPYAEGGNKRPDRPYGWSGWSRWPEFGLHLAVDGALRHYRGPRDERGWPRKLLRGQPWPWMVAEEAEEEWHGPTKCMEAVIEFLTGAPGQSFSGRQLYAGMSAIGSGWRERTVAQAAEQLVSEARIEARSGPRGSRLYSISTTESDEEMPF